MKPEAYLDTSVFVYAKQFPQSNSARIVELLANGEISAVVSFHVLSEVYIVFRKHYGKNVALNYRFFIIQSCRVVERGLIVEEMIRWKGKIKEKDLEHVSTVKALKLETLIAFDRDFEPFPEYQTPKQFIQSLGLKPAKTEY